MYPIQIPFFGDFLGAYSLGAYSVHLPILGLESHSLDWGPTVWRPTVWGPAVSGYRFWARRGTHTFESLGAYILGPTVWGPTVSGYRFWARRGTHLFERKLIEDLQCERCLGKYKKYFCRAASNGNIADPFEGTKP